jgi:hypothetical protein
MSLWIRIGNLALKISLEKYDGWWFTHSTSGLGIILGCLNLGFIWDVSATVRAVHKQGSTVHKQGSTIHPNDLL